MMFNEFPPDKLPGLKRRAFTAGTMSGLLLGLPTQSMAAMALDAPPLREIAARQGIQFGTAVGRWTLTNDPAYQALALRECAVFTCENEMKWPWTTPQDAPPNFADADWIAGLARANGKRMRGHTLLWQLPPWATSLSASDLTSRIDSYIATIMPRYPLAQRWDVVNEPLMPTDGRADGLKISPFLSVLGVDYIEHALYSARKASPTARLFINEYGFEYVGPYFEARRTALLNLIGRLLGRGVPLDGVGLQCHLTAGGSAFSPQTFRKFLSDLAGFGLRIELTEIDVSDAALPAATDVRDAGVADEYERFLTVALDQPAVRAVLTWGLQDGHSWLNAPASPTRRSDGLPSRPLPFDDSLGRKPAWWALARSLAGAPMRTAD